MTGHQAAALLFGLALIAVLSRVSGRLAVRLGQPAVVGEISCGIALGPTLFAGRLADVLFPSEVRPLLAALAGLGVALFMFTVGLEFDSELLRGRMRAAVTISTGSVVLPLLAGAGLAVFLLRGHQVANRTGFVLFMAVALAVTAFPVLARILREREMHRTETGTLALAAAAVGDVLAWSLLALVVGLAGGETAGSWKVLLVVPYGLVLMLAVRPLFHRVLDRWDEGTGGGPLVWVLVGLLLSGGFTEYIGLHFIFGCFAFGAALPHRRVGRLRHELLVRLEPVTTQLLLPVYFVLAGLRVDLSGTGVTGIGELVLITAVAIAAKMAGAYAGGRSAGLGPRPSTTVAVLMNTRGLTELVVLTVGLELGLLDAGLYSLMVVMAVVTTAMTGPALALLGYRRGKQGAAGQADTPLGTTTAPPRRLPEPSTQKDNV